MKKQLKYILITLAAALVLGIVALVAVLVVPDAADDTSSSIRTQEVMIYEKAAADLELITVTNQHGSFEVTQKASGNFEIKALDGYEVVQSYVNSLATTYSALEAKKLVTDSPEDLSLYGLDEPLATIELEFKDETITLSLGNTEATTNGYYCKLADSDSVYLISSGIGGRLLSDKLYYLDRTVTPEYDPQKELIFDSVVLSGSVRDEEIVIVPTPDAEDEDYAEIFGFEIVSPANAYLNLSTGNDFLTSFFVLSAESVEALAPDEVTLKEYGFDNPYSVAEIKSSAADFTVTVGKVDGDYCYVMNDTQNVIYKCPTASMDWVDVQYPELVSNIFLVPHIGTVSKVTVTTPDKEYAFSVSYDAENFVVFAKHGDKTLNSENFQNFYQVLVSCYMETYNTEQISGEPYMTLTYEYNEGGSDTLELYLSSDVRQSLIVYNGKPTDFSVRTVYVEKVIADCERVLNGEEISTTW